MCTFFFSFLVVKYALDLQMILYVQNFLTIFINPVKLLQSKKDIGTRDVTDNYQIELEVFPNNCKVNDTTKIINLLKKSSKNQPRRILRIYIREYTILGTKIRYLYISIFILLVIYFDIYIISYE